MTKWTAGDIPDQGDRVAVVTGANSGIGLIAARELARHGASVVLACRDVAKGERAAEEVRSVAQDGATVDVSALDLASLASVEAFAGEVLFRHERIDLLVNNAGLMAPPRGTTADGFELQIGTNHLGHFALTGRLIDRLSARPGSRVVTISSGAHKIGKIDFGDLNSEQGYNRWRAYGQSKLANLMFALELDRRLSRAGSNVRSVAAHPGYAATNLQSAAPPLLDRLVMHASNLLLAQSADMGALPTLYAATFPDLPGGSYVGPDGLAEQRGHPTLVSPSRAARDEDTAAGLWELSEELTGVRFGDLRPSPPRAPSGAAGG